MEIFYVFLPFFIVLIIVAWDLLLSFENKRLKKQNEQIEKQNRLLKQQYLNVFGKVAEFTSDLETLQFDYASEYLQYKKRPALKEALRIQELKAETKEHIRQYKLMRYEYDLLFGLFPELENYIDYHSINEAETMEEIKENYDYVQSWLTKEEYKQLDTISKNQLALNRYIQSRQKNKWSVGRDYELYIGYEYEKQGFKVLYTGISEKISDKGRDLIARKGKQTLIIQCKNWSKQKEIHEKHICQLFGSTVQFNIENSTKAKPIFVTSTSLSKTAFDFANYLGVEVIQNKEQKEFPRIKCNIGSNGEKIYHLPFDQQYDNTIIGDKKGEFFAWTVEEAENKGFRRAKKHFFEK